MKLFVPVLLAVLLAACQDVDRYATPTPAPFAGVVVASTDQRAEGEVVAGVSARREQAGAAVQDVATPRPIVIFLPTPTPGRAPATSVPTAVAGVAERRGTTSERARAGRPTHCSAPAARQRAGARSARSAPASSRASSAACRATRRAAPSWRWPNAARPPAARPAYPSPARPRPRS
jgi:hypothetical protein